MRAVAGTAGTLSIVGACVLGACLSSSPSPSNGTDGGVVAQGDDGGGAQDASTPIDSSPATDAPATSCVWPDAGCSYSGTGAETGMGWCNPAVVVKSATGTAQLTFLAPMTCVPLFEFTAVFNTPTLTPGTYTRANVQGTQGVWAQNGTGWFQHEQPTLQGSFTLIVTDVGTTEDDAGTLSAHGSLTAYLPGDQNGNVKDAGVSVTATF